MRMMRGTTAMLVGALLGGLADGASAQPAMWQGYANAAIAAHARRVGGQAPRESRQTCEGDVSGDGKPDAAVLYVIEGAGGAVDGVAGAAGGQGWKQYLLVMVTAPQGVGATTPKEIGAAGMRRAESCTLAVGRIQAVTKEWAPADPACCPSRAGVLHLGFDKGKVLDVPAPAASAP